MILDKFVLVCNILTLPNLEVQSFGCVESSLPWVWLFLPFLLSPFISFWEFQLTVVLVFKWFTLVGWTIIWTKKCHITRHSGNMNLRESRNSLYFRVMKDEQMFSKLRKLKWIFQSGNYSKNHQITWLSNWKCLLR